GRSKSTCPGERAKRAARTKAAAAESRKRSPKPRRRPPPGVTTDGQSLRAQESERSERRERKRPRGAKLEVVWPAIRSGLEGLEVGRELAAEPHERVAVGLVAHAVADVAVDRLGVFAALLLLEQLG